MINHVIGSMDNLSITYEVIVVNDGSQDKSKKLLKTLERDNKKIKVIHHEQNKGYGSTLRTGFQNSSGEWLFFTDSDKQFSIKDLKKLLPYTDTFDMIIGYRKNRKDSFIRILNAKIFNLSVRVLFNLHVKDIDCAFKLFRREIIDNNNLESNGALVNTELLIKAKRSGYRIKEVAVNHYPRLKGKSTGANISVILRAAKELIDFRFNNLLIPVKLYEKLS
ncbi:MAG: glycosyltransferase family 2 protein [Patescibacteria group bacterium]|nr:glycosyltransferase family 2 protein [Patescibacteria group bacterium]